MSTKAECRECGKESENEIGVTIWFCCKEHEKLYWGKAQNENIEENDR